METKTYRLSPTGRRTTLILLVAALIIWGFALWSFNNTLKLSENLQALPLLAFPQKFLTLLSGLPLSQLVPALLLFVLLWATPLLIWNLLEEWAAAYTPTPKGLLFESLGISLIYPWEAMQEIRRVDDDDSDPMDEIILLGNPTQQIKNPLLRFLHTQGYGRNKLPIYPGLAERESLLTEIRQHVGLVDQTSMNRT